MIVDMGSRKITQEPSGKGPRFLKVGECLYRETSSRTYYGLVKRMGKQIRKSLKTKDRKLAERRLKQLRAEIEKLNPKKEDRNITFKELAERWIQTIQPHLKEASAVRRKASITQLNAFFENTLVRNITRRDCENWAIKRSPNVSSSSFNNERETLIAVFQYGKREGLILENPAVIVKRRKLITKNIVIPTNEEFETLRKTLRQLGPRYSDATDLVEILAYSGMRLGEATEITWNDIDFKRNSFLVTGGEKGTKNYEIRRVPLFPAFSESLKRIKKGKNGIAKDLRVTSTSTAKKAIEKACRFAKLPHFTHHCLRHYFVSTAIEQNIDFKTIAAWIGHKDGGLLVAQTYGHLRNAHSNEMAKRMTF